MQELITGLCQVSGNYIVSIEDWKCSNFVFVLSVDCIEDDDSVYKLFNLSLIVGCARHSMIYTMYDRSKSTRRTAISSNTSITENDYCPAKGDNLSEFEWVISRWLLFFKVMIFSLWNLLQYHSIVRWVIQAQWAEPLVSVS
jgi:hypothetical protein